MAHNLATSSHFLESLGTLIVYVHVCMSITQLFNKRYYILYERLYFLIIDYVCMVNSFPCFTSSVLPFVKFVIHTTSVSYNLIIPFMLHDIN